MNTPPLHRLPPRDEMLRAFLARDAAYDGLFWTGVRTTGIFCRPTCTARKPKPENVEFFADPGQALFAGYRPCKRCRPLRPSGAVPEWIEPLLARIESDPERRLRDADLRDMGLQPARVRRWFKETHGLTFHGYQRARRLGGALDEIRRGRRVSPTAFDHGFDSLSGFNAAFARIVGDAPTRSTDRRPIWIGRILTPLGPMVTAASDEGLHLLEFADRRQLETQFARLVRRTKGVPVPGEHPLHERAREELMRYFEGDLSEFTLPLAPAGTEFQQAVWTALRGIPYGATRSYAEQARSMGRPTAVRAVARANGDNPLAIIVPCHRVVGSDGSLTGYGGGLHRKRWLLDLENGLRPPTLARAESPPHSLP